MTDITPFDLPATPKWKRFEHLVANIQKDLAPEGFVVTPNDKILGQDTETMHVKKSYYHGEVPLKKARGLHNAITGRANIVVNMNMDDIEFDRIEHEWQPIQDLKHLAVEPMIYSVY